MEAVEQTEKQNGKKKYKGIHNGQKKGKTFQPPVPMESNKKAYKKLVARIKSHEAHLRDIKGCVPPTKPGSMNRRSSR